MDSTKYRYNENDNDKDMEVVRYICTIEVDCHSSCDICEIRLASIFQEDGNYCLECWQERTHPS
jgi:hypothetical protein